MRRAVDGLFKVVTFETTLPPLKDVTVTFLTAGFLTVGVATALAVRVVEVLRVLRFLGAVALGVAGVFDLTGIKTDSFDYFYNIAIKNPL
jgi:hypothetical protein